MYPLVNTNPKKQIIYVVELRHEGIGTIIVGDLNVHSKRWLSNSNKNNAEGELLRSICSELGLRQLVREPTRGEHLLDLAFTDLDGVRCRVLRKVADHNGLSLTLPLSVPRVEIVSRNVWQFREADWLGLNSALAARAGLDLA